MKMILLLYIGDSDRDASALEAVGLMIAPNDASEKVKVAAHVKNLLPVNGVSRKADKI